MISQLGRQIANAILDHLAEQSGFDTVIEKMDQHDRRNLKLDLAKIIDQEAKDYERDSF